MTHAAKLLGRAALQSDSGVAAATAASAVSSLFHFSICHGFQLPHGQQTQHAGSPSPNPSMPPEEGVLQLPEGIPPELLEGTEEGRQLRLQEEQRALRETEATLGDEGMGPSMPIVEVVGCFKLDTAQHVALLHSVLVPLARRWASEEVARTAQPDDCPPLLLALAARQQQGGGEGGAGSQPQMAGPLTWTTPELAQLVQYPGGQGVHALHAGRDDVRSRVAVVAALLEVAVQEPRTILLSEPLRYSNCSGPWEMGAVLYLPSDNGSSSAGRQGAGPSMRALRQRLAALVVGGGPEGAGRGPTGSMESLQGSETAVALQETLVAAVEASPFVLVTKLWMCFCIICRITPRQASTGQPLAVS